MSEKKPDKRHSEQREESILEEVTLDDDPRNDLLVASMSSTTFWDNAINDEVWNAI